jgi:hypothetical protein
MLLCSRTSRISIVCCGGNRAFVFRVLHKLITSLAPLHSWFLHIKVKKPHLHTPCEACVKQQAVPTSIHPHMRPHNAAHLLLVTSTGSRLSITSHLHTACDT